MMLPTDAAITTRRSSLSGTLAALIGLPSYRARCVHQAWMFVRFRPAARPGIELRHNIPDFRFIRKHSETAGGNSNGPGGQVDAARDTPRPPGLRGQRRCLRATPVLTAASATAAATAGTTPASNIDGVMYSSLSSLLATMAASAWAAASFIWSFTRLARTSSMPRKKPGKQQELLIWFG